MITVTYIPRENKIKLTGHAGAGSAGNDIVCAACSMVFYNLVAVLREYPAEAFRGKLSVKEATGNQKVSYIKASPIDDYATTIGHDFYYAMVGFETLAANYPEYIKFEVAE